MRGFLASGLAGALVIVGGWFGWVHADRVDALIAAAIAPFVSSRADGTRQAAAGPLPSSADDPYRALSIAGTEPSPGCVLPGPVGADGMNRMMRQLDGEPTLQGGDHGGSVALADGRRMFVYGDTIRDVSHVSPFMVRNSVLIAHDGCVEPVVPPGSGAVIPDDPDDTGHWPMSLRAVEVLGGTKVQVIVNRVRATDAPVGGTTPESPDSFETLGSSLATFEIPTDRSPRLVDLVRLTPDGTDPRVPTWGAAMWEHDGRVYVFGTASDATKSTAGWSLHVARVAPEQLAETDAWQYWDGTEWVRGRPEAAQVASARLIPAEQGVSHVLSVFERDGAWFAVSKEGDFTGDTLAIWKAPTVTGPWTKHPVRALENSAGIRRYTPLAHPDVDLPSGRLLVSWSEAPVVNGLYYTDPGLYRPRFAEVELP